MKRAVIFVLVASMLLVLTGCSLFDKEITMLVYLEEELTDAEARSVATKICAFQEAIEVEYVTAEQAYAEFVEKLEDPSVMEGVDTGILRNRCVVTVMESDSEQLAREIKKLEGVDDVSIAKSSQVKETILDIID